MGDPHKRFKLQTFVGKKIAHSVEHDARVPCPFRSLAKRCLLRHRHDVQRENFAVRMQQACGQRQVESRIGCFDHRN